MDQELIAYLEERFRESSRQIIEGVRSEVGTLRQEMGTVQQEMGTLRQEMGTVQQEMVGRFEQEVGILRQEMGTLRQEMVGRFEQVDEALRENREATQQNSEAIRQNKDEIRYTQIMVEGLRSDLQGVAEGVLSTNQRLDAFQEKVQQEFKEVRTILQLSHTDVNKRVRSLEEWRKRVGENPVPRLRKKSAKKS